MRPGWHLTCKEGRIMEETELSRIAALEKKVDLLTKKLEALEETVQRVFEEVRELYEHEDFGEHA